MANVRRMTINPPLTEAEFAAFRAAYPAMKIDREPSGVITVQRNDKGRDDYGGWLLSQRGTISSETTLDVNERRSIESEVNHSVQDYENLQALEALEGRLVQEREASEGAHAAALNVAIRALASHIDILESIMAHEQGMPQEPTGGDRDTYDQRRKLLKDAERSVGKS